MPDTLDVWLAYRIERQQQFTHLVRAARDVPDAVTAVLGDWIMVPAPEPFKTQRGAVREFILAVDHTMTFRQRAHFIEHLQEWIDDLENAKAEAKTGGRESRQTKAAVKSSAGVVHLCDGT